MNAHHVSAAIPGVLPPVLIDGEHFIDGGVVNSIPVSRAVELGANEIWVLQVGRVDTPLTVPRTPVQVALVTFEIARRHRFARDLARAAWQKDSFSPAALRFGLPGDRRPSCRSRRVGYCGGTRPMPLVTVKVVEGLFAEEQKARLISKITQVVLDVADAGIEVEGGLPDKILGADGGSSPRLGYRRFGSSRAQARP